MSTAIERIAAPNSAPFFIASTDDLKARARTGGWAFWRGVLVGFLAAFPIASLAAMGQMLPGIVP